MISKDIVVVVFRLALAYLSRPKFSSFPRVAAFCNARKKYVNTSPLHFFIKSFLFILLFTIGHEINNNHFQ